MDKWACAGELGRLWEELAKTALRGHFCLHLIWPRQVTQLVGDVGGDGRHGTLCWEQQVKGVQICSGKQVGGRWGRVPFGPYWFARRGTIGTRLQGHW